MTGNYLADPLVFLLQILFGLYILVVLLRFFLQLVRADFYNPVSQLIVKLTGPILIPLRKIIPGIGGWDIASLALAWLLQTIQLSLIIWLQKGALTFLLPAVWAIPELIELSINIFLFGIFIQVILSWINPGTYNPAVNLLYSLTEPLIRPVRKLMPTASGIDFSPMLVMLGLVLLKMLLLPPLQMLVARIAT